MFNTSFHQTTFNNSSNPNSHPLRRIRCLLHSAKLHTLSTSNPTVSERAEPQQYANNNCGRTNKSGSMNANSNQPPGQRCGNRMLIYRRQQTLPPCFCSMVRVGPKFTMAKSQQCPSSRIRLLRHQSTRILTHTLSLSLRLETGNSTFTGPVPTATNIQHPTTALRRHQSVPLTPPS